MKEETKKRKNGFLLLSELSVKYSLPEPEICGVIEDVFSRSLSSRQGRSVLAFLNRDKETGGLSLEYLSYVRDTGGIRQYSGKIEKTGGLNTLIRRIEFELLKKSVIRETVHLKQYEGEICSGVVRGIREDGAYYIDVSVNPGEVITGVCPVRYQAPHERGCFNIGDKRVFHIRSFRSIILNGAPRMQLVLDRISERIAEKLILNSLPIDKYRYTKVRCIKRISGSISLIETSRRIPRDVILNTGKELREKIKVVF